jgi:hypothetical protein
MNSGKLFNGEAGNNSFRELSYAFAENYILENTEITGSRISIHNNISIISLCIEILRCPKLLVPFLYTIINLCTHCTQINSYKGYSKKIFFSGGVFHG